MEHPGSKKAKPIDDRTRGFVVTACLGCALLVFVVALLSYLLLKRTNRASPPTPNATATPLAAEWAGVFLDVPNNKTYHIWVNRSKGLVALEDGVSRCVAQLSPRDAYQDAFLIRSDEKTVVHIQPSRLTDLDRAGKATQADRLPKLWKQEGSLAWRDVILRHLPPSGQLVPPELSSDQRQVQVGPAWQGHSTQLFTYSRATRTTGRLNLAGPTVEVNYSYVPELGIISSGKVDSLAREWRSIQVGPVESSRFEVPATYREKWGPEEMEKTTVLTPFAKHPPAGYHLSGGSSSNPIQWNGKQATELVEHWLFRGSSHAIETRVYIMACPEDIDSFLDSDLQRGTGLGEETSRLRPKQALVHLKSGSYAMRKGNTLAVLNGYQDPSTKPDGELHRVAQLLMTLVETERLPR